MNLTWAKRLTRFECAQIGLLLILIFIIWAVQTKIKPDSWNDTSRLAAVQALVEQNTWHIEETELGDWTGDKIFLEGHFYSSKPPLLTVLTAVPYRFFYDTFGTQLKLEPCAVEDGVCAYYWLTLLVVGLPAASLVALFFWQARRNLESAGLALFLTALFACGTMIWPFSLVFNNHIPAATCLFASFLLIKSDPSAKREHLKLLAAGLLAGLAISFELAAIFLSAALALLALVRHGRSLVWFVLGGIGPLLVTVWLDYQMIGTLLPPYFFSQGYDYPGGPFSPNVGGAVAPDSPLQYTFRSLLGDRGLLLYSPLLLWAIAGLIIALRKRGHPARLEAIILGLAILAHAVFIFTRTDNFGGKAYGARYFILALPFLFYFLTFSLPTDFRSLKGKVAIGAFLVTVVVSVWSAFQGAQAPWQTIQPPLFLQTRAFTPSLTICSNIGPEACLDRLLYPCGLADFGLARRRYELPPMDHRLEANFADRVILLGYDLPDRRIQRGQALPLTLYWQSLTATEADYIQFNHLLDDQLEKWANLERLPVTPYTTSCWVPGEVIVDRYDLQIDEQTPAGIYTLLTGLYPRQNGYLAPLPLVQSGQALDTTSVNLGRLKIGGAPPGLTLVQATPDQPLDVSLGQVIALRGFDLSQQEQTLVLGLYWQSLAQTETDYTVFIHVLDARGEVIAQMDRPPLNGHYPTSLWDAGEIVLDEVAVPLPQALPANGYSVHVGLYNFADGTRLPVPGSADNGIKLTVVE